MKDLIEIVPIASFPLHGTNLPGFGFTNFWNSSEAKLSTR